MCVDDENAISKKPPLLIAQETQQCTENPTQLRGCVLHGTANAIKQKAKFVGTDFNQNFALAFIVELFKYWKVLTSLSFVGSTEKNHRKGSADALSGRASDEVVSR